MKEAWHALSVSAVIEKLSSSEHGLTESDARARLKKDGENRIPDSKPEPLFLLFVSQFQSPLIYLLLVAAAVIYFLGDHIDAGIILAVLVFNAVVGATQEGRAQNTLRALKHFVETSATVLRGGKELIVSDREVVVGDIVVLQEGEKVPADARLISTRNLKVDEASFTGESEPVLKNSDATLPIATEHAEQITMVFKGTHIVSGNARAIVVATGLSTVIGSIAAQVSTIDTEIPLKANIRHLAQALVGVVLVASTLLFFVGITVGYTPRDMFTTVVSLAVSVVPEGLPIVLTLVLATGVWRMSRRNALVKRLQAVEALGQARVIAVDKTGTITQNELIITRLWTDGQYFDVSGVGYEPSGTFERLGRLVDAPNHQELLFIGRLATFCASARLSYIENEKRWKVAGDPTEAAMLVLGEKMGFHKDDLLSESPFLSEIPFDYQLKYHATVHRQTSSPLLTVIGAPEVIISHCTQIRAGGKARPLTDEDRTAFNSVSLEMAGKGLRVLAVSYKENASAEIQQAGVDDLTFVGFFGMKDALRPGVADATKIARDAGMRVVMITGDHQTTARAIAAEAGIFRFGDSVLSGADVDALSDSELARAVGTVSVFARVSPEHKLRIIRAYKRRGEIVAMTGDGVNDAPSLVAADLGVAMGKVGTEVAKEASDIVLLDDNFGSIVAAIEEGRGIYKSIQRVMLYLLSSGLGEMFTIIAAILLGFPLPILATQIIWLNFVTNGFLDIALAMEPKEDGLLAGTFEQPSKYILDLSMVRRMVFVAIPMMLGTLGLFSLYAGPDLTKAWTVSLTTLAVFQWFNAWNCRSDKFSLFHMNPTSNKYLIAATTLVVVLQLFAVYHPFMQKYLHTTALSFSDWLLIIPVGLSVLVVDEVRKYILRRTPRHLTAPVRA